MRADVNLRDAVARLIAPKAWQAYDAVIAPYVARSVPENAEQAWAYALTHDTLGFSSLADVDAWFRQSEPGSHGMLSVHHADFQDSLRTAQTILSLVERPADEN